MTGQNKAEKLEKLLDDLQAALDKGSVAVVEGPNDEKALRALGITGKAAQLSKRTYSELAEQLAGECREVVLLTDFDAYGNKAAKGLRDSFLNECVRVDMSFRTRFKKLLGYTEFEDVPSLFENEMNR